MNGFLPPVAFVITANATQAMATFKGINTQLKIMDAQAKKTGVAMAAMSKSILLATAATKAMAVAFAGFAAYGVKEIMDLQAAYTRLGNTMSAVGVSTEENRTKAADVAQSYEKLGFDAGAAADALGILLQSTRNLDSSQKLLNISADLARARQMDLATASRLVARANGGSNRLFQMYNITLDKTKSKSEATKEAFEKLSAIIGGQAVAYTQTLQGQLAILGKQIENVAEGIGAALLPYLQKFVGALIEGGKWIGQYKGALNTLAVVISTVVTVAIGNLIKKLTLATAAWIRANAAALGIVAVIIAAAAGIVYFWNKYEGFRKAVIGTVSVLTKIFGGVISVILLLGETAVMVFSMIMNAFFLFVRATANAQIKLGQLFGDEEMQKRGKATLDFIDNANKNVTAFGNKIVEVRNKVDTTVAAIVKSLEGLKDTKIDLSKFQLPSLKIADFGNWGTPETPANDIAEDIKNALIKARQHIADFNAKVTQDFERATKSWASVINRNFTAEIEDKLARNLDDLIYQAQDAVNEYQAASNSYNTSLKNLTKTQEAYIKAIETGDDAIVAAAESAMKAAEDIASGIVDSMNGMLDKIEQIQDSMIDKIVDLKRQIADLEKERTKVLENAQKERIELEKSYNEDVAKIRKQYDRDVARAQADAAKRSAEIVKQSIDQLRGVFKSATYKSLGDIYSGITYEGRYMKGGTAQRIIANLGLQAGKAQTLANNAASLAAAGFSQTFIEEVVSLGPDMGNSLANTILTSTPESIAQMKAYWEQLQAVSGHGVDNLGKKLNSGLTLATEELTQQLADVQTELNATLKELDGELNASLTEAFNDYSKALDAINIKTAETIANIDSQIAALTETIRQLNAALASISKIQAPGIVATAPNIIGDSTAADAAAAAAAAAADKAEAEKRAAQARSDAATAALEKLTAEMAARANAGSMSAWRRGEYADMTITNNIYGAVDAQEVADATAWSIRTSGDVQYRVSKYGALGGR